MPPTWPAGQRHTLGKERESLDGRTSRQARTGAAGGAAAGPRRRDGRRDRGWVPGRDLFGVERRRGRVPARLQLLLRPRGARQLGVQVQPVAAHACAVWLVVELPWTAVSPTGPGRSAEGEARAKTASSSAFAGGVHLGGLALGRGSSPRARARHPPGMLLVDHCSPLGRGTGMPAAEDRDWPLALGPSSELLVALPGRGLVP